MTESNNDNIYFSDKYKPISQIGSGSFGEVYKVQDVNKKQFAAKIEEKRKKSRLRDEYDIRFRNCFKAWICNC